MHDSNVEERAYKLLQDTIKETWWVGGQVECRNATDERSGGRFCMGQDFIRWKQLKKNIK